MKKALLALFCLVSLTIGLTGCSTQPTDTTTPEVTVEQPARTRIL